MFYVGKGRNGVVIMKSYSSVCRFEKYLTSFYCKKVPTFEEAEKLGLEHLRKITPYIYSIPKHLSCGQLVTVRMIKNGAMDELVGYIIGSSPTES